MREIKFRGRSLTNGKWVCGDSIKHTDNATENGIEELIYIGSKVPNASKVGAMKWVPINPSTVGQYTGLKDRKGKEIYEGDIVRFYDDIEDELETGTVIWHTATCSFCVEAPGIEIVALNAYWEFEVVGNIHDNPDLIK